MAVLERAARARRAATSIPTCTSGSRPSSSPRRWWVPETFPRRGRAARGARPRRRCTAASAATCCSPTRRSTSAGSRRDRERAIALARRALVSGELVASGALGFQFAGFSLVSDRALRRGDRRLRRRASIAAERRGDLLRAAPIRMFRGRAKLLRGDLDARARRAARRARADHGAADRHGVPVRGQLPRRGAARARRAGRGRGACSRRPGSWTSCR